MNWGTVAMAGFLGLLVVATFATLVRGDWATCLIQDVRRVRREIREERAK